MNDIPVISVIIPTYQRRDVVVETVSALGRCTAAGPFEVIVAVDGSTDGTADALAALDLECTLIVIEQANQGAAAARNTGARRASGELLLFIDDDMIADPQLLAAHVRRQAREPGVVLGHIPVHPSSPRTVISEALSRWVSQRSERLTRPGVRPDPGDWLSGQFSIPRADFERLEGFDAAMNREGRFGGEDTDFFHRAHLAGIAFTFAPDAISWQLYVVTPESNLRQWREGGASDAYLVRKHPALLSAIESLHRGDVLLGRASRYLLAWPVVRQNAMRVTSPRVAALARRHPSNRVVGRAFVAYRQLEYWAGVADAGGLNLPARR
jgi:glycosyltransferase involved in cell wall biosynthesis